MAKTTVYPEWVQNYQTQGKTEKKVGNTYYLYKRTSRRIFGKKYYNLWILMLGLLPQKW